MRDTRLDAFLDALAQSIAARAPAGAPVDRLQAAIFARAKEAPDEAAEPAIAAPDEPDRENPEDFVNHHLADALGRLPPEAGDLVALGNGFRALAGDLDWAPRPAGADAPPGFRKAHANATLVGVDGLERRSDIRIGASLMAPGTTYPAHRHPPEELYLVLSDGDWRNTDTGWWTPGTGGLVHNPPGIEHAMRAGEAPLFAIWCLLVEPELPRSP
jgi:quercetin dioxygenase-like cupin family protein